MDRITNSIIKNKYILGTTNVFIILFPISLLSSFIYLVATTLNYFQFTEVSDQFRAASTSLIYTLPSLFLMFFSFFLASRAKESGTCSVLASVASYFSISFYWNLLHPGSLLPMNFPLAVITPIVVNFFIGRFSFTKMSATVPIPSVISDSINVSYKVMIITISLLIASIPIGLTFEFIASFIPAMPLRLDVLTDGILYEAARGILWSLGMNGHVILGSYKSELYLATGDAISLYNQGIGELPILSTNFYDLYSGMGDAGNTISLMICMLFLSKNEGFRRLAKVALLLAIFNINEPIIYGLPVMFNPILIVPFLLAPIVGIIIAYGATSAGFVPPLTEIVSWMTPPLIGGYIGTGNSIAGAALQLFIIIIGVAIYYPFFKKFDLMSIGAWHTPFLSNNLLSTKSAPMTQSLHGFLPNIYKNIKAQEEVEHLNTSGEFVLYYQPQYNMLTQKVDTLEALLRHRSDAGDITPPHFIDAYAQLGIQAELDLWVIENAFNNTSQFAKYPNFKISINVSPATLLMPDFVEILLKSVTLTELTPMQVELEITEELLVQEEAKTKIVLDTLRKYGFSIALDDFGSGFSSLGYLSKYVFDKVKIDRSLLLNSKSEKGKALFSLAVKLGAITEASIVVEGVETQRELSFVSTLGIERIQGFYFYKPMPVEDIIARHIITP